MIRYIIVGFTNNIDLKKAQSQLRFYASYPMNDYGWVDKYTHPDVMKFQNRLSCETWIKEHHIENAMSYGVEI